MDYEIIKTETGELQIWTPDETGACIGSGKTVIKALADAIDNLEDAAKRMRSECSTAAE